MPRTLNLMIMVMVTVKRLMAVMAAKAMKVVEKIKAVRLETSILADRLTPHLKKITHIQKKHKNLIHMNKSMSMKKRGDNSFPFLDGKST